jgi:hypothetical protein
MFKVLFNNEQVIYLEQVLADFHVLRTMEVEYSNNARPKIATPCKPSYLTDQELQFILIVANNDNCGSEDWTKKTAASIVESLEAQLSTETVDQILFN